MSANVEKYKNTILYLVNKLDGKIQGKKKLAKLLYFVDFDFFEKYESSITGAKYKNLPMGPYPTELHDILKSLEKDDQINITLQENSGGYSPTEVFEAKVKANIKLFSSDEIKMLDRVIRKYGELNGGQLEQLTHGEAPYIGTHLNEEIPYELSFYRNTDFAERNA